jgi:hypothetical protein
LVGWYAQRLADAPQRNETNVLQRPRKSALHGLMALVRPVFTPFPHRMRTSSIPRLFTGAMGIRTSGLDDQPPPAHPVLVSWIPQELARRKP